MVLIMPLILYPSLGIGMAEMMLVYREQPRTVVILGEQHLPEPELLKGNQISGRWFEDPTNTKRLTVVTETQLTQIKTELESATNGEKIYLETEQQRIAELLENAHTLEAKQADLKTLEHQLFGLLSERKEAGLSTDYLKIEEALSDESSSTDDDPGLAKLRELQEQIDEARTDLASNFATSGIQVLVLVPDGFGQKIEQKSKQIANREQETEQSESSNHPDELILLHNNADQKSQMAYQRVKSAMASWENAILKKRLEIADLPESITAPVNPQSVDLASRQELSANVWGTMIPALVIIMTITGAFYPAVDLVAGEKERGTMETLLICPASRTEIVWGKFFTVLAFSIATAVLNLLSLGMTTQYMASMGQGGGAGKLSQFGVIAPPSFEAILWVILLLIPIAALYSALSFALATFARSSKEGQYYLTPMLAVSTGLTVFCASPAVEITPFYSIIPVIGVALLLKGLLSSPDHTTMLIYVVPVLITSTCYSLLALWWAIDQFGRESVLFRESERFSLKLWFLKLLREKEDVPSFAEATICFMLIMFLQFPFMSLLQKVTGSDAFINNPKLMLKMLMIQQLSIIAFPALIMGVMLTNSFRKTFRLYLPKLPFLAMGLLLPFCLHPLSLELSASLSWFFPPLPDQISEMLSMFGDPGIETWLLVLAFAVAPGICEEIAFRGFILSGLARHGRMGLSIVLSSIAFGVMHMIPAQVFNATLLGLVLGLLCVRSRSLLPGILFHIMYNSLAVLHGRFGEAFYNQLPAENSFFRLAPEGLRYEWPTLVITGILATGMIYWIYQKRRPPKQESLPN